MFHQGVMITIVSVFGDFQVHRRTIESYLLTTRINEMRHCRIGTHIVIDHHTRAVDPRTDSIVEDQWHTIVHQHLEMVVSLGVLGLRHDDATHLILIEVITDGYFLFISLIALRHHHTIATSTCLFLDARKHRHKVIMDELWHDDSYHLHRLNLAMAQGLPDDVGIEVMFTSIGLDSFLLDSTDARAVLQSSTHRGDADAQVASNIFHCYRYLLVHCL